MKYKSDDKIYKKLIQKIIDCYYNYPNDNNNVSIIYS